VLMTKFGESGKTGLSGFLFWTIRFWQFHDKTNEGAKFEDLKIQGILRHGERGQDGRNPSQKPKPQKSDGPVLNSGVSGFLRTDSV
jgi:hypothetical protein